jgi:FkbM family methyltransferase
LSLNNQIAKTRTKSRDPWWQRTKERVVRSKGYAAALYLAGYASGCPFNLALKAAKQNRDVEEATVSIRAQSTMVEEDAEAECWRTPYGQYWIPKRALSAESLFDLLGERRAEVYGGPHRGVRRGDVVLDCGSNIGTFVAEALDAGAARVVACEPSPGILECLRRNAAQGVAAGRVVVYPKGLWHETAILRMSPGMSPAGDSFLRQSADGIELPVTTIDALAAELGLDRIDFIKMDIEGAERNALQGGRISISRFRPRLALSAYHLRDDPEVLPSEVRRAFPGYKFHCNQARLDSQGVLHSRISPSVYFFTASGESVGGLSTKAD